MIDFGLEFGILDRFVDWGRDIFVCVQVTLCLLIFGIL
jgi:hypothetical protein